MADDDSKKKPSRRDVLYDRGKEKKSAEKSGEKKPEAKAESKAADSKASDKKPEAESEAPASPMEGYLSDMAALSKRHETERRDHHGNTREALRAMAKRHDQDFKDLAQRQADTMAKMSPPAEMPPAGEAPGGATQVAEGAAPPVA